MGWHCKGVHMNHPQHGKSLKCGHLKGAKNFRGFSVFGFKLCRILKEQNLKYAGMTAACCVVLHIEIHLIKRIITRCCLFGLSGTSTCSVSSQRNNEKGESDQVVSLQENSHPRLFWAFYRYLPLNLKNQNKPSKNPSIQAMSLQINLNFELSTDLFKWLKRDPPVI